MIRTAMPAMVRGSAPALSPDDGGGSGGLSVADAVAFLDTLPDEEQAPAAAAGAGEQDSPQTPDSGAQAGDDENSGGDDQAPAEAAEGAENPEDGEETDSEEAPVVAAEPPKYWSKEAKARFAELEPELQAVVLAQEGPREEAASKAKDEAARTKQAAEKELADVSVLSEHLQKLLPRVLEKVRDRWGDNPDWVAYARQNGAERMAVAKAQWEQDRADALELARTAQATEVKAVQAYVAREFEALKTLAPELTDPKEGQARRQEVVTFLNGLGIPPAQTDRISAVEMTLAREAMLYRKAQAKAKTAPTPPPKPAATRPPVTRAAAARGPTDPKAKQVHAARSSFGKSRSIADAVSLLNSYED